MPVFFSQRPKSFARCTSSGGQVGPGAAARVFVFDASGLTRAWGHGRVLAEAGLDTGLLVGADHELLGGQRLALPLPGVEVQDAPGLDREGGIARKDPGAVLPRADGVFVEPAPHRGVAEGGDEAGALGFAHDVGGTQA